MTPVRSRAIVLVTTDLIDGPGWPPADALYDLLFENCYVLHDPISRTTLAQMARNLRDVRRNPPVPLRTTSLKQGI